MNLFITHYDAFHEPVMSKKSERKKTIKRTDALTCKITV